MIWNEVTLLISEVPILWQTLHRTSPESCQSTSL